MRIILFGATGMIGQGVLRECLRDPEVERVLTVGRAITGQTHPKLEEIAHADLTDFAPLDPELAGYDACFFCLGVSSAGMTEDAYRHLTYDLALTCARTLVKLNPQMIFLYVSGVGTDSTEKGRTMWARVKGATENALLALPFKGAYMIRPGAILPMHGIKSRTPLYNLFYAAFGWLGPMLRKLWPDQVTTTEELGRAMLAIGKRGAPKPILEPPDFIAIARALPPEP